jgi:5-methyltetrahydrofolate--homocysteine methyltransferase
MANTLHELGIGSFGGNCGNGPDELLVAVQKMRSVAPDAVLVAKSNAGVPEMVNGVVVYRATPQMMADSARKLRNAGARVIGGCCGTTPEHITSMAQALK